MLRHKEAAGRKKTMNRKIIDLVTILIGNTIYALAVVLFIMPNNLITGGTTGIALTMEHFFKIPVSGFVMLFNLCMFAVGALILGKKFALTTAISTFYYPVILGVLERFLGTAPFTEDIFLNTVFAGLLIGAAIGIVVKAGASTGGMDIPPLVLYKTLRIPVSVSMYVFDCLILLVQLSFRDRERLLYGICLVFIYTIVIEKILVLGRQKIQLQIVSVKTQEIREAVLRDIDRGVTLLHGETGYMGRECDVVYTVISSRELAKVERLVHEIDEQAFLVVSHVSEVSGRGFTQKKKYEEK